MSRNIAEFAHRGYLAVEYPPFLKLKVLESIKAWKEFCALPMEVKRTLPYSNGGAGVGYECKDGTGNKADRKENFDATTAGWGWLRRNHSTIHPQTLHFAEQAANLVEVVKSTIHDFAGQCETHYDGMKGFFEEIVESEANYFLRFIHYFGGQQSGDEIASAHVDQSGFTLHLFESDPGLQYLPYANDDNNGWTDMPVSAGETVIIPAMQMQLRSHGRLRALAHRVVANDQTAVNGRYSAVCFVQFKNTPKYDKDTHGRLQEKQPGFNYGLCLSEFAKLFK